MSKVVIYGYGISFDWCPLSVKNFKRLTNKEKPEVEREEMVEDLLFGPKSSSYWNILNGECELLVDEKVIRNCQIPSGKGRKIRSLFDFTKTTKYMLVREDSQKGNWNEWRIDDFELSKLSFTLDIIRISKNNVYDCLEIDGVGIDLNDDYGCTMSKSTTEYILDCDGNCHEIYLVENNSDPMSDPNAAWPF